MRTMGILVLSALHVTSPEEWEEENIERHEGEGGRKENLLRDMREICARYARDVQPGMQIGVRRDMRRDVKRDVETSGTTIRLGVQPGIRQTAFKGFV